jgi:hypothetical protein
MTLNLTNSPTLLNDYGIIFVEGPDAASFLQNQLTNSVLGLKRNALETISPNSEVRLVGYCSAKGRLLATAWLSLYQNDHGEDCFVLFLSKDIAASFSKRLSMFVLRSKVKVMDMSDSWQVGGVIGLDSSFNLNGFGTKVGMSLPDLVYQGKKYHRILLAGDRLQITENATSLSFWQGIEIASGIPRITSGTQDLLVPQMVNFESVGGVDFKKGCYPGQEVVARSQYRGVIKRRLFIATAESTTELSRPGTELFHSADPEQPAGLVILSAPHFDNPQQLDLQIELKLEFAESLKTGASLCLGSISGPRLSLEKPPYSLLEI